jgi:hypothetical protein
MSFESEIQKWVSLDNKIKTLNDSIKDLREERNNLTNNITNYAEKNELFKSTIQISDGRLRFSNSKIQEPLTFKYIERTLAEIIPNNNQVQLIMKELRNRRESKYISEIKRYNNN